MHGFKGERVLMRIHVGKRDQFQGKPLYQQIVELLRRRQDAGATAFRGVMSFGASSKLHTDRFLELSLELRVVIECVETEERIKAILPELAGSSIVGSLSIVTSISSDRPEPLSDALLAHPASLAAPLQPAHIRFRRPGSLRGRTS